MAAVDRELTELQLARPEFVVKGHSRVWRISSSSPPTPEANRTSASSAPRPDTPVEGEGDNMEVSEREERPSGATTPSTYADVSRPATREKDPGNALSREIEGKELPPFSLEGKELPPFSPPLDQFPGALQRALADEPPPPPAPAPTTTNPVG